MVGEAGDGREGIDVIREERPDVALVDYQMPDLDGLAVVHAVVRDKLPTRVLLLSAVTDGRGRLPGPRGGRGRLPVQGRVPAEIVDAVLRVAKGANVVPAALAAGLADQIRLRGQPDAPGAERAGGPGAAGVCPRPSIPQVARELFIGESTVKTHTQRLYEKLGVSDRAAAVAEACARGCWSSASSTPAQMTPRPTSTAPATTRHRPTTLAFSDPSAVQRADRQQSGRRHDQRADGK